MKATFFRRVELFFIMQRQYGFYCSDEPLVIFYFSLALLVDGLMLQVIAVSMECVLQTFLLSDLNVLQ
jgi:hypothetical protein